MAKKCDIHSFCYIDDTNGVNTLNGTSGKNWEEYAGEYPVACFNGLAYFASKFEDGSIHCFIMNYPKYNQLNWEDREDVKFYCGFRPCLGEYGVICGCFGNVEEKTIQQFKEVMRDYPVSKADYKELPWLEWFK